MDGDASGRDARMGIGSFRGDAVEHEHWKVEILQDVVMHLDAIPVRVRNGVSVSVARMRGLLHISLELAKLASAIGKEDEARSVYSYILTARQEEIMLLLDIGMKPKEIAHYFTLSEATVRTHIRNACRLLNVKHAIEKEGVIKRSERE